MFYNYKVNQGSKDNLTQHKFPTLLSFLQLIFQHQTIPQSSWTHATPNIISFLEGRLDAIGKNG